MNNINPADPFGLTAKTQAAMAAQRAEEAPAADAAATGAEKQKRTYVRRGAPVSDSPVGSDELVLGYFFTGGLSIQKGKVAMTLTPSERAQLFAFMEKVE